MIEPTLTVIQSWPSVLGAETASVYLGVSKSQFFKLVKMYPEKLRSYNLVPNGDAKWSRESLDEFRMWRESIGVEKC